jgi:hypothetical protein
VSANERITGKSLSLKDVQSDYKASDQTHVGLHCIKPGVGRAI